MKATIDNAGRVVIPKVVRDRLGLLPGEVEIMVDGTGVRIEPVSGDDLIRRGNRSVVPPSGSTIDDDAVRALRDAG